MGLFRLHLPLPLYESNAAHIHSLISTDVDWHDLDLHVPKSGLCPIGFTDS